MTILYFYHVVGIINRYIFYYIPISLLNSKRCGYYYYFIPKLLSFSFIDNIQAIIICMLSSFLGRLTKCHILMWLLWIWLYNCAIVQKLSANNIRISIHATTVNPINFNMQYNVLIITTVQ